MIQSPSVLFIFIYDHNESFQMTDSNERWADSSEKSTERYGNIKDSTALGRGSYV